MTSSTARLAKLPSIFTASDAMLLAGVPKTQLNVFMHRWKTAGYVRPLGARADVWFNLVVDREVSRERWERALRLALPETIVAGHSVLMRAGVTTQMTSSDYLLRAQRSASAQVDGVELAERPVSWITRLRGSGAVVYDGLLPELDPGAAIADLLRFEDGFDAEELDWGALSEKSMALFEELRPVGVEVDALSDRRRARDTQRRR